MAARSAAVHRMCLCTAYFYNVSYDTIFAPHRGRRDRKTHRPHAAATELGQLGGTEGPARRTRATVTSVSSGRVKSGSGVPRCRGRGRWAWLAPPRRRRTRGRDGFGIGRAGTLIECRRCAFDVRCDRAYLPCRGGPGPSLSPPSVPRPWPRPGRGAYVSVAGGAEPCQGRVTAAQR